MACPHKGDVEIRVVGITDDIFTVSADRNDFTIHNDMTDGDERLRVTCSCGKHWEAPAHSWEDARLPSWVKRVFGWFEEHRHAARDAYSPERRQYREDFPEMQAALEHFPR